MKYWLFKSESDGLFLRDAEGQGQERPEWDGVRNYAGAQQDAGHADRRPRFSYHSNEGLDYRGHRRGLRARPSQLTTDDARWECVDIRAFRDVPNPPTLARSRPIRNCPKWRWCGSAAVGAAGDAAEWKEVCRMGGVDPVP